MSPAVAAFVVLASLAFVVWFFDRRLRSPIPIAPLDAKVYIQCPVCKGHGRKSLAVDPRKFTKYDDQKLKFEDFPQCEECYGTGQKLFLSIAMQPPAPLSVGSLLQAISTYRSPQPGACSDTADSPLEKSPSEPVGTSSTPSKSN